MGAYGKHHYIPKFHIRRFAATRSQLIWQFDKATASYDRRPAANATWVRDYYLVPGSTPEARLAIERRFHLLETKVAPVMAWIDSQPAGDILIPEGARDALAEYVAILHARVPAYRSEADKRAREMEQDLGAMGLATPEQFMKLARRAGSQVPDARLEEVRLRVIEEVRAGRGPHFERHASLTVLGTAWEKIRPILVERNWLVVRHVDWPGFVIGDQPVTLQAGDQLLPSIGFGTPGVLVRMPISPSTVLLIQDDKREARLRIAVDRGASFREPWWAGINKVAWLSAQRWVWAAGLGPLQATEALLPLDWRRRDLREPGTVPADVGPRRPTRGRYRTR